jgi:hypothetical protein
MGSGLMGVRITGIGVKDIDIFQHNDNIAKGCLEALL